MIEDNAILLLGNGINRYAYNNKWIKENISWEQILLKIAKKNKSKLDSIPEMFPFTEVFDIIKIENDLPDKLLKNDFVEALKEIKETQAHRHIIDLCREHKVDILTTNFDLSLENVYKYEPKSDISLKKGFTHWYPWQRYYTINDKTNHIKIWHIQGDAHYPLSVKLSVKDYIYSYNHFNKYDPLNNKSKFGKSYTWVENFFNKKLVIVGIGLEEQEFFLRQLLFKKKEYNKSNFIGWYVYCEKDNNLFTSGKPSIKFKKLSFFAKAVGLKLYKVNNWDDIYD